jgi:hypothetical protein
LLLQPLRSERGYLGGYLTVKNLWRHCMAESELFRDADFMLAFLRSYFYEDLGLVATLLDPTTSGLESGVAIGHYIADRFNALIRESFRPAAEAFEERVSRLKPGNGAFVSGDLSPAILTHPTLAEKGRERYEAVFHELATEPADPELKALAHMDQWMLAQRETMCLASVPATLRISKKRRVGVFLEGIPMYSGPGLDHVEPGEADGTLQLFVSPTFGYLALVASVGGRIAHLAFLGDVDEDVHKQFLGYNVDRDAVINVSRQSRKTIEELLERGRQRDMGPMWRKELLSLADSIYGHLATVNVAPDRRKATRAAMSETGFWQMLFRDQDLVRSLALLGLASSVGAFDQLQEVFRDHALDYDTAVARLAQAQAASGFPLMGYGGDQNLGFV